SRALLNVVSIWRIRSGAAWVSRSARHAWGSISWGAVIARVPFEWDVGVSSKASRGDRFYFAVDTPTGVNVLRDSYTTLPDATVACYPCHDPQHLAVFVPSHGYLRHGRPRRDVCAGYASVTGAEAHRVQPENSLQKIIGRAHDPDVAQRVVHVDAVVLEQVAHRSHCSLAFLLSWSVGLPDADRVETAQDRRQVDHCRVGGDRSQSVDAVRLQQFRQRAHALPTSIHHACAAGHHLCPPVTVNTRPGR